MKRFIFFPGILVLFLFTDCHHNPDLSIAPPFPPPVAGFLCSPDTIYFQNRVLPITITSCAKSGCHDEASHKRDLVLDSYSGLMTLVTPFDPTSSKLYTILFNTGEERMPPDGHLSTVQEGIIYYWIKQGALNNKCDSANCDTLNVTYTKSIDPIIQTWCAGCHSNSSPANGISLTNYSQVVASVNGGRFMGAIRQQSGFYPMPKGSILSPCEINLFQKWIDLGFPQ
jgi:hypothetical protein